MYKLSVGTTHGFGGSGGLLERTFRFNVAPVISPSKFVMFVNTVMSSPAE